MSALIEDLNLADTRYRRAQTTDGYRTVLVAHPGLGDSPHHAAALSCRREISRAVRPRTRGVRHHDCGLPWQPRRFRNNHLD